jgi:hypothetical protein
MKRVITLMIVALFPVLAFSQNSAVDKVFKKYGDKEGFTVVTISKGLLKMAADIDNEDAETQEFLNKVNSIKILATEDNNDVNLYDEVLTSLDKSEYEELMTAKSDGEDVLMLAKKSGDVIEEFIILVGGKEDNALVYISGKMSMKDMAKLSKSIHIEGAGFEHVKDLEK